MQIEGAGNSVAFGKNIELTGVISGNNNVIKIGDARVNSGVRVHINGDNNRITINNCYQMKDLTIHCGNHIAANDTFMEIGDRFSIEPGCAFYLYNSRNRLTIGSDCLFSSNLTIRCGESPHLIFDLSTGEYLDVSEGVFIGNHVWLGEKVYITKRVTVPDHCIVAACAVVTKRFSESNTVIGGNPAKVAKRNVHWVRNKDFIEKNSIFETGLRQFDSGVLTRNINGSEDAESAKSQVTL